MLFAYPCYLVFQYSRLLLAKHHQNYLLDIKQGAKSGANCEVQCARLL